MAGWQRHLQYILRRVGKRVEHSYSAPANFSSRVESSLLPGEIPSLRGLWKSPSPNPSRPLYHYLQQLGISSARNSLAASSDETPVASPLSSPLALSSGKTEEKMAVCKPLKVNAVLKNIKQSPKKLNLVATLVRGMRVEDALLQLQVTIKRASKTVYQVCLMFFRTSSSNIVRKVSRLDPSPMKLHTQFIPDHGLDADRLLVGDRLLVAEAFVGKGFFKKRVSMHAKGKSGIRVRPECRLTVVVREMTPEEEGELARLRVHNFRKLTKRERQLVPHKLIETTPIWDRKGRGSSVDSSRMAA